MDSTDPPEAKDVQDDLPEDPAEGLDESVEDEVADELPAEIEMETEEISSGVEIDSPDGTKKQRM